MNLVINVLLLSFGFTGTLAAFGGDTWRKTDQSLLHRVTRRGWVSLGCLFLALTLGIVKEIRNYQASAREFTRRKFLEQQLSETRQQLAHANERLQIISNQVERYRGRGKASISVFHPEAGNYLAPICMEEMKSGIRYIAAVFTWKQISAAIP